MLPHKLIASRGRAVYINFEVAAVNGFGVGPFSDPVNATLYSQGISISVCFNWLSIY